VKILIAEDNPTQRLALQQAVKELGHECLVAEDGSRAWALVQEHRPEVLVSDWMMPGMTGPELSRRVRAERTSSYTYIILLTILDDIDHTRFGMQAGADDYLTKPLDRRELEMRLIAAERVTELHRGLSLRAAEQEAALQRREGLLRLAQQLPAEGDPQQLLLGLLAEAAVLVGGAAGVVSLWEEGSGALTPIRSTLPTGPGDPLPSLAQAATARALERSAPVLLNDYQPEGDQSNAPAAAAVAAPLVHDQRVLGAIAIVSHELGKRFTPADAEVLQELASIAAAALVGFDRVEMRRASVIAAQVERQKLEEALPANLPARSAGATWSLPTQPTPVIGREADLQTLELLVGRRDVKLVTLVGPAGVGKTRLALELGWMRVREARSEVRFVDLTRFSGGEMVVPEIAAALGNRLQTALDAADAAAQRSPLLIIIDSFEHVVSVAERFSRLVGTTDAEVTFLVTSRAALRIRSEHTLHISPLTLPDLSFDASSDSIALAPAVRLFVERARAVQPEFMLTPDNLANVAAICTRLDGLPLAIELAAAQTAFLPLAAMLSQVQQGLGVLTGGNRDMPRRHRTLTEAIGWSYTLLTSQEQRFFRALSVFADGIALDAVSAVCHWPEHGSYGDSAAHKSVLTFLGNLIDKSLVLPDRSSAQEPRFDMLQTIRGFAREQLEAMGEVQATRHRYSAFFLQLAEQCDVDLVSPGHQAALARLQQEEGNLRAALEYATTLEAEELELRLAAGQARFWSMSGRFDEGQQALDHALGRSNSKDALLHARVARGVALLAARRADWALSQSLADVCVSTWRDAGESSAAVEAMTLLALARYRLGNRTSAVALVREALGIARQLGDPWAQACALQVLAEISLGQGNYGGALGYFAEELSIAYRSGITSQAILALEGLAAAAAARGHPERALRLAAGAAALRDKWRMPLHSSERELLDRRLGPARAALDESARAALWREGYARAIAAQVDEALEVEVPGVETVSGAELGPETQWLTARQRQVAILVAEGLQNSQIGERLGISPNTVEVHLSNILRKLAMNSRAKLAVWAVDNGLYRPPR
jgi:predicted ATPase/DNA-binding NarL/FixJ family response regulator